MNNKTKGETIAYAIKKECQRDSLVEWCESWEITLSDFYDFLAAGQEAFDSTKAENGEDNGEYEREMQAYQESQEMFDMNGDPIRDFEGNPW